VLAEVEVWISLEEVMCNMPKSGVRIGMLAIVLCLLVAIIGIWMVCVGARIPDEDTEKSRTAYQTRPIDSVLSDESSPIHRSVVSCFNNVKDESGAYCSGTNYQEDGRTFKTGKMSCGYPGKVSEIDWVFLGRYQGKDKYRFARQFPSDSSKVITSRKEVQFEGSRVVVFEDEDQRIVIESPKQ